MTDPRRSIESLRAGVPNQDAVQALGTNQREIETRFLNSLAEVPALRRQSGRQLPGFLIQGGFGTGKSHLLEWLQHLALEQGFAVSKVVVSKEAPLSDPHRVFRAAVESLRLPDHRGRSGLHEVAADLKSDTYRELHEHLTNGASGFDPIFAATLYLFQHLQPGELEFVDRLVAFWSGDRLSIADVRRALRQLGNGDFDIRARKVADLAYPRFRFVADLIGAVGRYQGWIILLDEVELVARFSLAARARSYATLAHLMGVLPQSAIPGLFTVGCATDDFTSEVFFTRRDHETVAQRLSARPDMVNDAEAGMSFMWPESPERWPKIRPLEPADIHALHERIRALYEAAHDWTPPSDSVDWADYDRSLRQYVREWITRWDLQRLYRDYRPQIERELIRPDLEERPGLEQPSEEEDDSDPAVD